MAQDPPPPRAMDVACVSLSPRPPNAEFIDEIAAPFPNFCRSPPTPLALCQCGTWGGGGVNPQGHGEGGASVPDPTTTPGALGEGHGDCSPAAEGPPVPMGGHFRVRIEGAFSLA